VRPGALAQRGVIKLLTLDDTPAADLVGQEALIQGHAIKVIIIVMEMQASKCIIA